MSPIESPTLDRDTTLAAVEGAIAGALAALPTPESRLVIAVSGGRDSMALLAALHRWAPGRIAAVASFDHGTGAYAREAAELVAGETRRLGVPLELARADHAGRSEAEWREARWAFLREVSGRLGSAVATAHTRDDQVETVVQRLLRGAGARGLSALAADGPIVRPWLPLSRTRVAHWASLAEVAWLDDPANADHRHQRVRVRHDLLPAIRQVDPGFEDAMVRVGERAADWRREVDAFADSLAESLPFRESAPGIWRLPRAPMASWTEAALAVVWPALLVRCGIRLNGQGTARLIRFTIGAARAGELRLPDRVVVVRRRDELEVRTAGAVRVEQAARAAPGQQVRSGEALVWPGWRIAPVTSGVEVDAASLHSASFPAGSQLEVRGWREGDRIRPRANGALRRISRYLAESGIPRLDRGGWPVVLLGGDVVWVPGVCRGVAAPHRSGRSGLIWYRSERELG